MSLDITSNHEKDVFGPVELPCSRMLPNRLVKVAMYEHLAPFGGGPPNKHHFSLYSTWAASEWGMVVTGNVQVSSSHLSLGRDIIVPDKVDATTTEPFRKLARIVHGAEGPTERNKTLAIVQLSHAGRQSPNIIGGRSPFAQPKAASAVRVGSARDAGFLGEAFHRLLFQTPIEMSAADIEALVDRFSQGARLACESGFDGIQLHAAHGYLLASFLSEHANIRTDEYSATSANSLNLLHRLITSIRGIVPSTFVVGIKINSSDYIDSTAGQDEVKKFQQEQRALGHLRTIWSWGLVDFIEVSGGTYEKPDFMSGTTNARQAFFSIFSTKAVELFQSPAECPGIPAPLILLTGGIRTAAQCHEIVQNKRADLLGFARLATLCPQLPTVLRSTPADQAAPLVMEPDLSNSAAVSLLPQIRLIGAGVGTAWYCVALRRLASDYQAGKKDVYLRGAPRRKGDPGFTLGALGGLLMFWVWLCL